uniref:Sialic acid-binding Ig-like lectin 13 n=1 Tax=Geotrypetes seraphini TaxID=260995 RepID=A0A6P8SVL3_GEOSA|nr:sialic acid-binding Ig-like lectin 13 [Geotrypetes seraphini]
MTVDKDTIDRFKLVGMIQNHDCTLRIDDAKKTDHGKYFFRIEGINHFMFSYKEPISTEPFVNVTDLWELPELSLSRVPVAETPMNITCTAPGRCTGTTPIFAWTGTLNRANSTFNTSSVNRDRTVTHASTITFTPSTGDQNKILTCEVYYPAVRASIQATLSLNMQFGPRSGDTNNATCNSDPHQTKCSCVIQSNPPPVIWWLINEELVTKNVRNDTMQVSSTIHGHTGTSNLTLRGSRSRIACISSNAHGVLFVDLTQKSENEDIIIEAISGNGTPLV